MEPWHTLNIQPIERVELSRHDFIEKYRFNKPVIAKGSARTSPACEKWTLEYLEEKIGDAVITVSEYSENSNKHAHSQPRKMPFRDFSHKFRNKEAGLNWYWFNVSESGNIWTNDKYDEKFNEEISILSHDFQPPSFLHLSELINAQIILGSESNSTPMHYDFAGEAKSLMQIKGRKHCLLVAPEHAHLLRLNSMFGAEGRPNYSSLDVRNPDLEKYPELKDIPVYEAVLEEGDTLYWPNFWLHDIKNLDNYTLAVTSSIDELPANVLMRRYSAATTLAEIVNILVEKDDEIGLKELKPFLMAARGLEAEFLNSPTDIANRFWNWRPGLSEKAIKILAPG